MELHDERGEIKLVMCSVCYLILVLTEIFTPLKNYLHWFNKS